MEGSLRPLAPAGAHVPSACRKEETVTVYPADVVLFEGILAFYSQEVRDLFQMKLFVDTDADTRLSRRGAFSRLQVAAGFGVGEPVVGPEPETHACAFPEVALWPSPAQPSPRISSCPNFDDI